MKKGIIYFGLFVFIIVSLLSLGFSQVEFIDSDAVELYEVRVEALSNTIFDDETANFRITVTSENATDDVIDVKFGLTNQWFISTRPLSAELSGIRFDNQRENSFDVQVKATALLPNGIYGVVLDLDSQQYDFTKRIILPIYYNVYPQNISAKTLIKIDKVSYNKTIDPRNEFVVLLDLRNFFASNEEGIRALISSEKFNIQKEFSIGRKEFKTITVSSQLDPLLEAHSGLMTVKLLKDDELIYSVEDLPYTVISYENLIEDKAEENYFLKTVTSYTFTNKGNDVLKKTIKIPKGFFAGLFTQTSEDYYVIKDSQGRFLAFNKEIYPDQSVSLTVTQNYRYLFFSLLAITIGVILYFTLRNPIIVKKKAHILSTQEGGITELKVVLCIKNRSRRAVKNVNVTEFIPKITTLDRNFPLGNLEPTKIIDHENKGTIIKWSLPEVERLEERIVSYKIKSKLSIIGNFRLSPAYIRFFDMNFNRKGESNDVVIRM